MKRCSQCKETKPLAAFSRCAQNNDGLRSECRACTAKRDRERRERDRNAWRAQQAAYHRKWRKTPAGKRYKVRTSRRYRERHPDRNRAWWRAERAVELKGVCEQCGYRGETERHHPDYSKPCEVQELCFPCHAAAHGRVARLPAEGVVGCT